jgi:hypothetical protein
VKWVKCNHRHALSKEYDYFYQAPCSGLGALGQNRASELMNRLSADYNEGAADHQLFARNPAWHLDRKRKRIWVRSDVLMMLKLKGHA